MNLWESRILTMKKPAGTPGDSIVNCGELALSADSQAAGELAGRVMSEKLDLWKRLASPKTKDSEKQRLIMWGKRLAASKIGAKFNQNWDIIVIGGGITGAGVARLAAAGGLKTLLVEARVLASAHPAAPPNWRRRFPLFIQPPISGDFRMVRQREELLREAPNLVSPLFFNLPNYERYHLQPGCCIAAWSSTT